MFKKLLLLALTASGLFSSSVASASSIYVAPYKTYQNTINDPCVFYGPGNACSSKDPVGWLDPVGPTNQSVSTTLTQTYAGTDYDTFTSVVSTGAFVVGLDINDTSTTQTLTDFSIKFYDDSNAVLANYTLAPPPVNVPNTSNGSGFADYVISNGCAGTVQELGAIDYCPDYLFSGFLIPGSATSVVFTFSYGGTGNDGPDKVFLINAVNQTPPVPDPGPPPVPEPGTLLLLGSGLLVAARRFRKRNAPRA